MGKREYTEFKIDMNLPQSVVSDELHFSGDGLTIKLKPYSINDNRIIYIRFMSNPYLLRVIDEGDYLSTPEQVPYWLCEVKESELLDWFNSESLGVRESQDLIHYAIYTPILCYDIIHNESPIITVY